MSKMQIQDMSTPTQPGQNLPPQFNGQYAQPQGQIPLQMAPQGQNLPPQTVPQYAQPGIPPGYAVPVQAAPTHYTGDTGTTEGTGDDDLMFFLTGQPEADFRWAAAGRYPAVIVDAFPKRANSGSGMLSIVAAISGGEFDGINCFDQFVIELGKPGAGIGVRKARGLGLPINSERPVSAKQLAESLKGRQVWIDVKTEPKFNKNNSTGQYDVPVTAMVNGQQVQAQRNTIEDYYLNNPNAVQTAPVGAPGYAPQAQMIPQSQPMQAPMQAQVPFAQPGVQTAPGAGAPQGQPAWAAPAENTGGRGRKKS